MKERLYWFRSNCGDTEIQPIAVPAPDIGAAIAQYREVYGFQNVYKIEEDTAELLTRHNIELRKANS